MFLALKWVLFFYFSKVNDIDFGHFTREEAANFLLNIRKGKQVEIYTQNKMDSKYGRQIRSTYLRPQYSQLKYP